MLVTEIFESSIIDTPEFKRWFANSKVVDKKGQPLKVYHGTHHDFTSFHPGSHFGTVKAANQRVRQHGLNHTPVSGRQIMPVYLRITNPLRVTDSIASDEAALLNAIVRGEYPDIDRNVARREGAYKAAQDAGYDGLVYENNVEHAGQDSWVVFNPNQVKSAISNTEFSDSPHMHESVEPIIDTPAFKKWFDGSQAVDASGKPLKLYHGTSKDVDFKSFKMPKNGVWFTPDPKSASDYAKENDSQNMRWDHGKGNYVHINTASRVIPVYLKMLNPKRVTSLEELSPEIKFADNYRRVQGIVFDKLRHEGYDSVIIGNEVYVMLDYNAPNKIKSAIGNKTFADNKKNIHETV